MEFLKDVARSYYRKYGKEVQGFCFVFPNKRSGVYFRQYLCEALGRGEALVSPKITTLGEVVEDIVGVPAENSINLLMHLYKAYRIAMKEQKRDEEQIKKFDEFWQWGSVALQDFDEADMNLVDVKDLFKNVKDLQEISADYLTDEQREVIRQYFGVDVPKGKHGEFWKSLRKRSEEAGGEEEKYDVRGKFLELWGLLGFLYEEFNAILKEKGISYRGRQYREAIEMLEGKGLPERPKRWVFVGFDNISRAEWSLFKIFQGEGRADFVWDFTGVAKVKVNPELHFMYRNLTDFPHPDWLALGASESATFPKIEVVSSPSNAAQAKITGQMLEEIRAYKEVKAKDIISARIAVIVPDEHLLLPLLYSLPEQLPVNLSIGYPMKETGVIALVQTLQRLQSRKTRSAGKEGFYYVDVKGVVSQPLIQAILGAETCAGILQYIVREKKFSLTPGDLAEAAGGETPELLAVFRPYSPEATAEDYSSYLRTILDTAKERLEGGRGKEKLEISHVNAYLDALTILEDAIGEAREEGATPIEVSFTTMALLADRLIASEKVTFEGEQLQGVQVLGLLESRNLDFDYMVVPSMLDDFFPRRNRKITFIPETLRGEYGLPRMHNAENTYTYYFYRMLSRAKEVRFIYDSRTMGLKSANLSRYLLQLQHLYADKVEIRWRDCEFTVGEFSREEISVDKKYVARELRSLLEPGRMHISATDFINYLSCPLKFYYRTLKKIPDDAPPTEFMDPSVQGTIIHEVMERLYVGYDGGKYLDCPRLVTPQAIAAFLEDDARMVREQVRQSINRHYLRGREKNAPLDGDAALIAEGMVEVVKTFLSHDRMLKGLRIHGCEIANDREPAEEGKRGAKIPMRLQIPGEGKEPLTINFVYSIDRVDEITVADKETGQERQRVRIIDYKTGSAHKDARKLEEVFDGNYRGKDFVQVGLYGLVFSQLCGNGEFSPEGVADLGCGIYNPGAFGSDRKEGRKKDEYLTLNGNVSVESIGDFLGEFLPLLRAKMEELLDCRPGAQFTATRDRSRCLMCNYRRLCGR